MEIREIPESKPYQIPKLKECLQNVRFLAYNMEQIAARAEYTLPDILYNRYHWFTMILSRYESIYGRDAGMEQQRFQMLEEISAAAAEVDWIFLESMEKEAARAE